ncbi:MAG: hypothetical protein JKY67_10485 [Pseudomonadales bacterium]|nr:hypothetical protein [Pseudomonadales bacterium]
MKLFFDNIDSLDQFTHELDHHPESLTCQHCGSQGHFVPHGFVYKNQHIDHSYEKEPVGKRIMCSNRYGRTGCGRTLRFYLADYVPALSRAAIHISLFFLALITGKPIQSAYTEATHTIDPRNAYRWLSKCQTKIIHYRAALVNRCGTYSSAFNWRAQRLQLLLPTMNDLRNNFSDSFVTDFQLKQQRRFM